MMNLPIAVDLDGTLVKTDTLLESILLLLKKNPLLLAFPAWRVAIPAHLKKQVANRVALNVVTLPYNQPLLEWLKKERAAGRKIVLITASDQKIAHAVADHLGIFSDVIASDGITNMRGEEKRNELVRRFGEKNFAYAANSRVDLAVWASAGQCIVVNASKGVVAKVKKISKGNLIEFPSPDKGRLGGVYLRAIRVHQWVKNILIFASIVLAHEIGNTRLLTNSVLAFASFCLAASAIYIINDLLDLESDRLHPRKRHRPFAAGNLSIAWGMVVASLLLLGSVVLAAWLPAAFWFVLLLYFLLTITYSLYLKKIPLVDVLILASLYTIRIFAGQAATGIFTSSWLLAFSMFFFLSLALTKRYSELTNLAKQGLAAAGRGYVIEDFNLLALMGVVSGYIAVLVAALYVSSADVTRLYHRPHVLWIILPLLLYWISRVWLLAHRGKMNEDPIVFAIKDKTSYLIGLAAAVVLLLAV